VNCAKRAGDRPKQPACEFSALNLECRFKQSKTEPSTFKEDCASGYQKGILLKSGYLSVVGLSSMKIVADTHRHAAYDNKHYIATSFLEMSTSITVDDLKPLKYCF